MSDHPDGGKFVHNAVTQFVHRHFLLLLIASYVLAIFLPQFGLWLHQVSIGIIPLPGGYQSKITPSVIMLSLLLFNAGLGLKGKEIRFRQPLLLMVAFLANILVPVMLVLTLRGLMGLWHNSDELQNLLVGLALIVSMPIAGSSTAWTQNANGNIGLSLALVLCSTVLSPVTTPLVLNTFGSITHGDYAQDLRALAQQGTNIWLCFVVVLPSFCGLFTNFLVGDSKMAPIRKHLKLINFILLLLLNYSNASTGLPQTLRQPDWDFLGFILIVTTAMCILGFAAGWFVSWIFRTTRSDQASLMFSLGMNNNGTSLVLASAVATMHPSIVLPIICYTLAQQLIAALVDWKIFRNEI